MKQFNDDNFLLSTPTARDLYHEVAEELPIIDYHCHLSPREIAEDKPFASITQLWLGGDHYKWRAMRANGIAEHFITGDASDWEKFEKWAATVPYTLRNPLYHWTHLELKTAFGIDKVLNPNSAREIYDTCNDLLSQTGYTPRALMQRYGVEAVCTTDDPVDTLEYHKAIAESDFDVKVLPAWRPDKVVAVETPVQYREYVERLGEASGIAVCNYTQLLDALRNRHDYFASCGCSVADHGVTYFPYVTCSDSEASAIFDKVMMGQTLGHEDTMKFKTATLLHLARMNAEKGWVQQVHYGPMRNVNSKMMRLLGPDTGFDSIGDYRSIEPMAHFLDTLNSEDRLAKTILYNLNPSDNTALATLIGDFQDGSVPGKIQMGSGWWFNDQIDGMRKQIEALSNQGLLSRFVGMLTDSRSFLSYPRHEYFRRTLCDILGSDVERGLIPESEMQRVCDMVADICYNNAKQYFNF